MDTELFESLLYQAESESLDFKVAQYPFVRASEDEKGELLKDILAFTNSWRQSDAHILVGVEEVHGGRSIPRGVNSHLLNRHLQQFVTSKTNHVVRLAYSVFKYESVEIGVLTIPQQDRPVYLLENYGKLRANVVYIRHGDTTAEATPDEIARMGAVATARSGQPVLEFEFSDPETRERFGSKADLVSKSLEFPRSTSIPLYGEANETPWGISIGSMDPMRNRDYYRELAAYLRDSTYLCSIGIALNNPSTNVAEDAIVTLTANANGFSMLHPNDVPHRPTTMLFLGGRPRAPLQAQRVEVSKFGSRFQVRALIGNVQPGTTGWAIEPFLVGSRESMTIPVEVEISANNLRIPIRSTAEIQIESTVSKMRVAELLAYADE